MKNIIILISGIIMIASFKKEASTQMLNEMAKDSAPVIKANGSVENGPYGRTIGLARIITLPNDKYPIQLADFDESNGPDLKVYLSKEIMPANFINLGDLNLQKANKFLIFLI